MLETTPIRIGTRGSPLAMAQAHQTRDAFLAAHGLPDTDVEIHVIKVSGDAITDRPLSEAGGKGLFTKELDTSLMMGGIDLAVHSAKDLPTFLPDAITIAGYLPREDVRDVWISPVAPSPRELPEGAIVGTASLRRGAMLRRMRPDVEIALIRGNVQTRLRKIEEGQFDGTLLALAGLRRLGLEDKATYLIPIEDFLPAAGQGAIGITARVDDERRAGALDRPSSVRRDDERRALVDADADERRPLEHDGEQAVRALALQEVLIDDVDDMHLVASWDGHGFSFGSIMLPALISQYLTSLCSSGG